MTIDKSHSSSVEKKSSEEGTVTQIEYQTTYEKKNFKKNAVVYLPPNYDSKTPRNIIYLLHGSTESADHFFREGNFKEILDKLNQQKKLQNTIVVFPTYYPSRDFVTSDYYADFKLNDQFAKNELINDLIPAVEGKYHTYANGISQNEFKDSRNHRAFGGFSMGAVTTWQVFENDMDYFSTFIPMAGDSWTIKNDGGALASSQTASKLAEATRSDSPFKILASVGSNDGTQSSMNPQI
ncbi:alpha/beta hydrolase [Lactobacillus terrae]|uniref:alpha/beta hydrolase n=1 Tax=Lactobacillus terrae TaxID=2269374 RepID=UPI001473E8A0|nr:alpha/beta hydrolase-fold protein [Lactobacillus terrae]